MIRPSTMPRPARRMATKTRSCARRCASATPIGVRTLAFFTFACRKASWASSMASSPVSRLKSATLVRLSRSRAILSSTNGCLEIWTFFMWLLTL